ncbi:hypothetical protein ACFL0P_05670 [Candidatus Omnitrophota bacterium]
MAQKRDVTPEKQLLKLIEDPKAKNAKTRAYTFKHQGLSFFSLAGWKGRVSFVKENFKGWFKGGGLRSSDIKVINKALGLCSFLLMVYFGHNIYISMINLKVSPDLKVKIQQDLKAPSLPEVSRLKNAVSYYLEKVRQRNIFVIGARRVARTDISEPGLAKSKPPSATIIEAVQHLRLAGISWSSDPDAMIEDTNASRTFFVKRGEMIGEAKVQAIFKDKIVLSYDGEEIELK